MQVELITRADCDYCLRAKAYLSGIIDDEGVVTEYSEKLIGVDIMREEVLRDYPEGTMLPIVKINGVHVGGYDQMRDYLKQFSTDYAILNKVLRIHEVTVIFTKADGTERTMRCTRNPLLIPQDQHERGRTGKLTNPDTMIVWEFDNGWRSFRIDSIKTVTIHHKDGDALLDGAEFNGA